ncbi:hypothetical protein [Paenibacillus sp. CF384]|uniref:hypothetical protein n=1 Tax=Paenibacillus sp. CF384 TaxID=1884382 RepID=UPI0008942362|nr:hypothetical protein [Paenibacillus sp. CF384]SDX33007.1 hypothetical protein SAMN05518855_101283 [Paenibacillus sp. CF384]
MSMKRNSSRVFTSSRKLQFSRATTSSGKTKGTPVKSSRKFQKCCSGRTRKSYSRAVYSTGILRRNPGTNFALVDLVNLGYKNALRMCVQVFDWSSGLPVALKVSPCNTTKCFVPLAPGTSNFVYADVSSVSYKYEVRISRSTANRNVILNVFGLSKEPLTPQTGNNVLQHALVRIK